MLKYMSIIQEKKLQNKLFLRIFYQFAHLQMIYNRKICPLWNTLGT